MYDCQLWRIRNLKEYLNYVIFRYVTLDICASICSRIYGKGAVKAAQNPDIPPKEPHETPAAPVDCKIANKLPAGTEPPYKDIIQAAHDPAAIPVEVNPSSGRIAAPSTKPPTPITAMQDAQLIGPPPTTGADINSKEQIKINDFWESISVSNSRLL